MKQNVNVIDAQPTDSNRSSIDGLFVKLSRRLSSKELKIWPKLRFIVTPTTGTDHLDLEYCQANNIEVVSLKSLPSITSNFSGTSEIALWLLLSLSRRGTWAAQDVTQGNWNRDLFVGSSLRNQTVGIVGLGRLGVQMANLCMSLGMKVLFFDIASRNLSGARSVDSISELFIQADVISIHVDDRIGNNKLISREILNKAKNLLIINTSRGFVIDEYALIDSMVSGKVAGFAADVLDLEQGDTQEWLFQSPIWNGMVRDNLNIVLTPHIGGAVLENIQTSELAVLTLLFNQLNRFPDGS